MAKSITADTLLSRHVSRQDRVLLVNPPVEETRYSWIRWNQPLDLLKLASHLRSRVDCGVELFDSMKPDAKGHVYEERLPRDRRYYTIRGERYPMRRFGQPYRRFQEWVLSKRKENSASEPTQVWITSLCSYWYESIAEVCRIVRQLLPNALIVLTGHYARLMPDHASQACTVDFVVSQPFDLSQEKSAFDLYGRQRPPFAALELQPEIAVAEAHVAVDLGITDFAFFADDVCRDDGQPLQEIVEKTKDLRKHVRYHIICGLHPTQVTPELARLFAKKNFAELHFEEADTDDCLDLDAYRRVRAYLREAGVESSRDRLSGFVWIGRPGDQLEQLILRSFQVLDCFGNLILKPYTPIPGSPEHRQHEKYLAAIPHREWSPHFFPFAELNGISRAEYHDLYRTAAFLTEKVRSRAFDFLNGTLGAQLLRESLRREVWNLGPSSLRVTD